MEPVHDIIFLVFFDVQTSEKAALECCYRLPHNFKKIPNMGYLDIV